MLQTMDGPTEAVTSAPESSQPMPSATHQEMANAIRALAMDAVQAANSGHPGMPMGMADVATILFSQHLKFDPLHPDWPDRDRFVLSAGHGSMLLYAILYLTGYAGMKLDELRRFRQWASRTPGHPEYDLALGIETTTGPLGQGLANAVGMALAERLLAARFGAALVDHYSYVIAGDGCLMEGISHEAISLAGHLKLNKLIVFYDDNHISIDGPTELALGDDALARFEASGWRANRIDGHDPEAIGAAISQARGSDRPSLIACRTTIGFGAPTKAGTAAAHGAPLGPDEIAGAREALGWPHPPFEIPPPVLAAWRAAGARGRSSHDAWTAALGRLEADRRAAFERGQRRELPGEWQTRLDRFKKRLVEGKAPAKATRVASQESLAVLIEAIPELIGGSADLTGSNGTKPKGMPVITPDDFSGRYLHYGVREHAMAATMSGIALHGGLIPYGGSFLIFTDYCRPAIRLAALMGLKVIYVMTHDSIGLGQDGPTHQPIEHLASLRAIPNLNVFRPCDAVETAECWALALSETNRPSVLALTRQKLEPSRREHSAENLSGRGAYRIAPASGKARAQLLATGSEVAIVRAAQTRLEAEGIPAEVISMPCWELFDRQDADYRRELLRPDTVKVALEAAAPFGWERYVGLEGAAIGITRFGASRFGASAPYEVLYEKFGITAEAVVKAVKERL